MPKRLVSCCAGLLLATLLSACSSAPPGLGYEPESALIAFAQVRETPEAFKGFPVRWSGQIVQTRVLSQGSEIEVVELPLRSDGTPAQQEQSQGRFIVQVEGLLDPQLYAPGRTITALGTYQGMRAGKIGEQAYAFALLKADHHLLWPKVRDVEVRYVRDPFADFDFPLRPYPPRHLYPRKP